MSVTVVIKNDVTGVLNRLASHMPKVLQKSVLLAAEYVAGEIRRNVMSTFKGRTGNLARSFRVTFLGWDSEGVSAGALSDSVYAGIQEEGGTIKPRNKKFLAIPLPNANVPVGKWPRDYGDKLTLIPRKGKPALLAIVTKKKVTPMFVLVPSATITGKGYIARAKEDALPVVTQMMRDHITKGFPNG